MPLLDDFFRRDSDSSELSFSDAESYVADGDLIPEQEAIHVGTLHQHPVRHAAVRLGAGAGAGELANARADEAAARTITIHEDTQGGCGGKAWPAATVLSNYISHRRVAGTFPYSRIFELGSGTGLVGLVAAVEPPADQHVAVSDLELFVPLMQLNADVNLTASEKAQLSVTACCWGEPLSDKVKSLLPLDLILAADCTYLESLFDPLISTLRELASPSTEIWISYKKRRKADKRFWLRLVKYFDVHEIMDHPDREQYRLDSLYLYRATLKTGPRRSPAPPKALRGVIDREI
ncbi:Protein-lysine N-methyltransferase efm6 [Polyrhizophydium stewartii]|uniref:Protein-lysine N-methyltransferase efm6 n=1 Tax=Polyrhizophydium stewartii TaxID=2732419 RepID=A0ABR4NL36_9FUNG|nr:hypothetical protein HK105_007650 [Polyrhizophydium stewartii]